MLIINQGMRCNQCDSLYINGVFCHETGCPNTYRVYNKESDEWEGEPCVEEEEDEYEDMECTDRFYAPDSDDYHREDELNDEDNGE